jgi:Uma2 family endonuclease
LFTVHEFFQMADAGIFSMDDRVELLAGEIVQMSPIGSRHAACVNRLHRTFHGLLGSSAIVSVQNPVRLDDYSEPQPDIAVIRFREDFYRDAHPGPADVLLIVEVADTSADVDRGVNVPLYARAGIPEVWVVDLSGRHVEVYQDPHRDGYRWHRRLGPRDQLTSVSVPVLIFPAADVLA